MNIVAKLNYTTLPLTIKLGYNRGTSSEEIQYSLL